MLWNPVFQREMRSAVRGGRCFWVAALYALVLGVVALNAWPTKEQALFGAGVGEQIFKQFRLLQLALALLFAPALTWSAISGEKEGRTWSTLRCTPLKPYQIVSGKLLAAMVQLLLFILASLPVVSFCFFLGGVDPQEVKVTYVRCVAAALAAGGAGIFCSGLFRRTYSAIAVTYVIVAAMMLLLHPLDQPWRVRRPAFLQRQTTAQKAKPVEPPMPRPRNPQKLSAKSQGVPTAPQLTPPPIPTQVTPKPTPTTPKKTAAAAPARRAEKMPLDKAWALGLCALLFALGATRLARRTAESTGQWFTVSGQSSPENPATCDWQPSILNPLIARELRATTHRGRRVFVRVVYALALLSGGLFLLALWQVGDVGRMKQFFAYYAVGQLGAVMLGAVAMGAYALTVEKEQRTFPLLLSTPLSARAILGGKLFVIYWHVLLLTLTSVPVVVLAMLTQVTAFVEGLRLLLAQLAFGFAFALIGLFFSLRAKRTSRALGWGLTLLLIVSLTSVQLLPLTKTLSRSRWGQVLMATNPLQTLYESLRPQDWETRKVQPPRQPPQDPPNTWRDVLRTPDGRTYIYFYDRRTGRVVQVRDITELSNPRSQPDDTGWFIEMDDLPLVSVFNLSALGYLAFAGLLWWMMRRKFRAWTVWTP
ncbi:MAG: ABC transporter permease [Abditibacteriales bacterium]|nr:ABC transporter permease [Abditibacteriales bacterium]MDW8367330.1 ABC transporter permease [Abditibacteriales bacterium]